MADLFLIAHLVRGEPAFDIAEQMPCPECKGYYDIDRDEESLCSECDDLGYWWIIPTSGHRAYPFFHCDLPASMAEHPAIGWEIYYANLFPDAEYVRIGTLPSLPDHYPPKASPAAPATGSLITALGLALRPATAPIRRRV